MAEGVADEAVFDVLTEAEDDVVVATPVNGPMLAASKVNTAVVVLQQRSFSPSDSQQYSAFLPNPLDPHSQIWTPSARKSYADELVGVS